MQASPSILFVTRSTIGIGGMQTFSQCLLRALKERETVRVIAYRGGTMLLPLFFLRAICAGIFFRGRVVHLMDAALTPIALIVRLFRPRLRITVTVHGLDVVYPQPMYQWCLRLSLRRCNRIVAVSGATKIHVLRRGVDAASVLVISPCIDCPPLAVRLPSSAPHVLLLGRQIRRKGTAWFLSEVFPLFLQHFPDAECTVAGTGPQLPAIHRAMLQSGIKGVVTLLGEVTDAERETLFAHASVFVLPSITVPGDMEGFGLVCIEAAVRGLTVVAADREGIPDAVHEGKTGLLFRSGDAKDCLRALVLAMENPLDPVHLRAAVSESFSPPIVAASYLSDVFLTA